MAQPHRQLNLEQQECSAQDLFDQRGQAGGRKGAVRSWLSHKELAVVTADLKKSPFYKRGIKKILLLISKNCLRHNVERHFFISDPGRAQAGFILVQKPPSALGAAVWPWQRRSNPGGTSWCQLGTKGLLPIPSSSMGTLPAASGGEGSGSKYF